MHVNLTPLMAIVIPLTAYANLFLAAALLFNGYSQRFAALFGCCVYSVIADPILQEIHLKAHGIYAASLRGAEVISVALLLFIIAEAWWVRERRVRLAMEILLVLLVIEWLLGWHGWTRPSYYMNCMLLLYNLLVTIYFIKIFWRPYVAEWIPEA